MVVVAFLFLSMIGGPAMVQLVLLFALATHSWD
jgi:hypothetical protein